MLAAVKLKGKSCELRVIGKWMTPIPFILALKEAGLNIFPAVYSHFYVVVNNKARVYLSNSKARVYLSNNKARVYLSRFKVVGTQDTALLN